MSLFSDILKFGQYINAESGIHCLKIDIAVPCPSFNYHLFTDIFEIHDEAFKRHPQLKAISQPYSFSSDILKEGRYAFKVPGDSSCLFRAISCAFFCP